MTIENKFKHMKIYEINVGQSVLLVNSNNLSLYICKVLQEFDLMVKNDRVIGTNQYFSSDWPVAVGC